MKKIVFEDYELSQLCLGTVQFGLDYGIANNEGKPKQETVNEIIDFLSKNGLNTYDTAVNYGNSQEVIGKSFKLLNNEAYIISKILSDEFKDIEDVVDKSLKQLNKDFLFALLLHDTKLLDTWDETKSNKIKELIEKKLIRYFGVSIYTSQEFEKAIENDDIKLIQIPFNLFDQRAIKDKWFEKAKKKGKLIFIRSIFLQGLLLMPIDEVPKKLEKAKIYLENLEKISKEFALTRNELALSFVNTVAKDAIFLFGCDNLVQAKENLNSFEKIRDLDENELRYLIQSFENISEDIYLPTRW